MRNRLAPWAPSPSKAMLSAPADTLSKGSGFRSRAVAAFGPRGTRNRETQQRHTSRQASPFPSRRTLHCTRGVVALRPTGGRTIRRPTRRWRAPAISTRTAATRCQAPIRVVVGPRRGLRRRPRRTRTPGGGARLVRRRSGMTGCLQRLLPTVQRECGELGQQRQDKGLPRVYNTTPVARALVVMEPGTTTVTSAGKRYAITDSRGHTSWVQGVSKISGSMYITIQEMNYDAFGAYDVKTIKHAKRNVLHSSPVVKRTSRANSARRQPAVKRCRASSGCRAAPLAGVPCLADRVPHMLLILILKPGVPCGDGTRAGASAEGDGDRSTDDARGPSCAVGCG